MSTMHDVPRPVNLDSLDWPAWTDSDRWELGPDPSDEDAAWWAEHAPHNDEYYDVEGLDEMAALEAAATDAMAWGLIPPDVAESIARTSIVGLMTESYADEVERLTGSRPSPAAAEAAVHRANFRTFDGR